MYCLLVRFCSYNYVWAVKLSWLQDVMVRRAKDDKVESRSI
jgi:hypothetical protein